MTECVGESEHSVVSRVGSVLVDRRGVRGGWGGGGEGRGGGGRRGGGGEGEREREEEK